ncbi:MAG: ABC transporter ATP-binding protein [Bacillales bacterium]|nr:ABC transporter ATP-binding protein [Bacillales bacterium]
MAKNFKRPSFANGKGALKRVLGLLFKHYKGRVCIVILCLMINSISSVVGSFFLAFIIDDVINPSLQFGSMTAAPFVLFGGVFSSTSLNALNALFVYLGIMLSIYLVAITSSIVYNQLNAVITQGYLKKVREEMFNNMEKLPIKYFDTNLRGDIMSTYTNDVDTLRQMISQTLPQLLSTCLTVLVIFFLMLSRSIWLTCVVLFAVIFIFLVTAKIGGGSAKFFMKQQKAIAKEEGFVEEMMNGQKIVKVFCHEEKSLSDFKEINDNLCDVSYRANKYANILAPIIHNIGNILYVLVAVFGVILSLNSIPNLTIMGFEPELKIGIAISFLTLSRQFANSFNQVSQQINSVVMALAGANRIFALLDEKKELDDGYVELVNVRIDENGKLNEVKEHTGQWAWKHPHENGETTYTQLKGDIQLIDVDFGYTEDHLVLHDVSVYANPGQKIALVGSTGAGKTTITNLINRFYDLADGKVRYDGININKIKKDDLRKSISIVLQDTSLFTGTVKENIKYGRLDATDEDVYNAAKIANAYDFITRLPQGFETMLTNDGANLSQGQRQLLSIARAAIADAPVLILDEATSSIDTRTEKLVQDGMDKLMKGRTVFVIAHRLSTIQNADCIMVLEHGRIIERGSHDDLISKKGTYYQLYTGAFELE